MAALDQPERLDQQVEPTLAGQPAGRDDDLGGAVGNRPVTVRPVVGQGVRQVADQHLRGKERGVRRSRARCQCDHRVESREERFVAGSQRIPRRIEAEMVTGHRVRRGAGEPRDRQVERGPGADEDPVAHLPDGADQCDVASRRHVRDGAVVLAHRQPAGEGSQHRRPRGAQVEDQWLVVTPDDADDVDLVLPGQDRCGGERRADDGSVGVGMEEEEADAHISSIAVGYR
jgi:hypothetical protein